MRYRLRACAIAILALAVAGRLDAQRPATALPTVPAATGANAVSISATLPYMRAAVLDATMRVLTQLGYQVAQVDSQAGRVATAPRFTWPSETAQEGWHGAVSPGVAVVVSAKPVGRDSTAVSVTAIAPVRPEADTANVGQTLRMVSALQVASALAQAFKPDSQPPKP